MKKKNARLREENEKKIKAKKETEQRQVKASKEPTPRRVSFEEEEDTEVMLPIEQNNDHSPCKQDLLFWKKDDWASKSVL